MNLTRICTVTGPYGTGDDSSVVVAKEKRYTKKTETND